jgi:hypothetical protein
MSIKLNLIKDPKDPNAKSVEMPATLAMRNIEPQLLIKDKNGKSFEQKLQISEEAINLAKKETIKRFDKRVNIQEVLNRVLEGIEQKVTRKTYYVGSQTNKLFCGPVIQIIPMSTFGQIGSGKSTYIPKAPLKDNKFQFEKRRQVSIKVGKKLGKDFVVVVARNGCVILEPNSYALFNMPVYVVNPPTGQYFCLNSGNRSLDLGPGSHLVLYTLEAPVIFANVLKDEIFKEKPQLMIEVLKSELKEKKEEKEVKETQESGKKPKEEKIVKIASESDKSNEIKSEEKTKIEVKNNDQKEKSDEKEEKEIESKSDEDSDKKIESNEQKSSAVDFKPDSSPIKEKPEEQTQTEDKPKAEEKPEIDSKESKSEVKEKTEVKPKPEVKEKVEVEPEPEVEPKVEVKPVAQKKQLKAETEVKQPVEPIAEPEPQNLQQIPNPNRGLLIGIAIFAALVSSVVFLYFMKRN